MGIKRIIKSSFLGELLISYLHCIECKVVPLVVSDEKAVQKSYYKETGKELNLEAPQSFSEKLSWYKLNSKMPLMQQCADKIDVRKYVKECGYGETLNEQYGIYSNANQIDISKLPDKFVIKASHGSHMNYIIKDKKSVNWFHAKLLMNSWLMQSWGWGGREWVYKDLPRRLVVEKYLEDESGELRDYKFFCFNGEPKFIQVDTGRFQNQHIRNFYDVDWRILPFDDDVGHDEKAIIDKPNRYEYMLAMATKLSKPFQFVRVDLYEVGGKVYFGELTFFHNGGVSKIKQYDWDLRIGEYWKLIKS